MTVGSIQQLTRDDEIAPRRRGWRGFVYRQWPALVAVFLWVVAMDVAAPGPGPHFWSWRWWVAYGLVLVGAYLHHESSKRIDAHLLSNDYQAWMKARAKA